VLNAADARMMSRMEDRAIEPPAAEDKIPDATATPTQRVLAGLTGLLASAAGIWAVFATENEVGTGALLLGGAVFLAMAIFGLVPVRFKVGDKEVIVAQAALRTLAKVAEASDPATREAIVDTMTEELEARGIRRDTVEAVETMLGRFERYSGSSNARVIHDALLDSGWRPTVPAKSTYIRWVYSGKKTISLFQNSGSLAVASVQAKEAARELEGVSFNAKGDALFAYADDTTRALDAIDALRAYANN